MLAIFCNDRIETKVENSNLPFTSKTKIKNYKLQILKIMEVLFRKLYNIFNTFKIYIASLSSTNKNSKARFNVFGIFCT